jgi:TetR/AcrR family transcriptional regulator
MKKEQSENLQKMLLSNEDSTENAIKQAAQQIFIEYGLAGARMQQIADAAQVNKALVNYYFRSKEKLFEIVFMESFAKFYMNSAMILGSDKSLFEKIIALVESDIDMILENPRLPIFIMNETSKNEALLRQHFHSAAPTEIFKKFSEQVKTEVENGTIRKIEAEELFMNILATTMFPFIGKPFFQMLFDKNDADFEKMMIERKKTIADFIINSISL